MKFSLGFSSCPNDTFIFDGMIHNKIDTEGLLFEPFIADVEELNKRAFAGELDITKLSYHAYGFLSDKYVLLDAGSALGNNCGPLVIAKKELTTEEIEKGVIAIPGKYTTANFLFSLVFPHAERKKEMIFSEIENAIIEENVVTGVIIHENRFTYPSKGLIKIMDLGEYWEESTGLPIPLGGIVMKRKIPIDIQLKINRVMQRSVQFAMENPEKTRSFVKIHAQEMDETVMYQHIGLYVNNYTLDLGTTGRKAVEKLFELAQRKSLIPKQHNNIFTNYKNI